MQEEKRKARTLMCTKDSEELSGAVIVAQDYFDATQSGSHQMLF